MFQCSSVTFTCICVCVTQCVTEQQLISPSKRAKNTHTHTHRSLQMYPATPTQPFSVDKTNHLTHVKLGLNSTERSPDEEEEEHQPRIRIQTLSWIYFTGTTPPKSVTSATFGSVSSSHGTSMTTTVYLTDYLRRGVRKSLHQSPDLICRRNNVLQSSLLGQAAIFHQWKQEQFCSNKKPHTVALNTTVGSGPDPWT